MAFTAKEIEEQRAEINAARVNRQTRAAFGSIVRRNISEIARWSPDERAEWLRKIGQPDTYSTEINKEISLAFYDEILDMDSF